MNIFRQFRKSFQDVRLSYTSKILGTCRSIYHKPKGFGCTRFQHAHTAANKSIQYSQSLLGESRLYCPDTQPGYYPVHHTFIRDSYSGDLVHYAQLVGAICLPDIA
jgi:hypothetical protein